MVFKATKLVRGWLIVSKTPSPDDEGEIIVNWKAREIIDCEEDVRTFAEDLLLSLQNRLVSVTSSQKKLTSVDLNCIISHVTAERIEHGVVKVNEAAIVPMDPQLSQVVHRKLKFLLKQIICNPDYSEVLANCLRVVKNSDEKVLLYDYLVECGDKETKKPVRDKIGLVTSFKILPENFGKKFRPYNFYAMKINSGTLPVVVAEENIYQEFFTNPKMYDTIGLDMCIMLDVALAKGGTEAVIESFYSTMNIE